MSQVSIINHLSLVTIFILISGLILKDALLVVAQDEAPTSDEAPQPDSDEAPQPEKTAKWKIDYDSLTTLYNGDDADALEFVCPFPDDHYCAAIDDVTDHMEDYEDHLAKRKDRMKELREVQALVREFLARLRAGKESIVQFIFLTLVIVAGSYLVIIGHFRFRNLFDPFEADPTKGLTTGQYLRMKYTAESVRIRPPATDIGYKELADENFPFDFGFESDESDNTYAKY